MKRLGLTVHVMFTGMTGRSCGHLRVGGSTIGVSRCLLEGLKPFKRRLISDMPVILCLGSGACKFPVSKQARIG